MIKGTTILPPNFPTNLDKSYSIDLHYTDTEERQEIINALAERISTLYASFLIEIDPSKRSTAVCFNDYPRSFPPPEKVRQFKDGVKTVICTCFAPPKDFYILKLDTDNGAGNVGNIMNDCEIGVYQGFDVHYYFPVKTEICIHQISELNTISVSFCGGKPVW